MTESSRSEAAGGGPINPSVESAFGLLGKKWVGLIVHVLAGGPRRFGQLLDAIPRISARVLSQRLAELEKEGITSRAVYAEVPVRVEYSLTDRGRSLTSITRSLFDWANAWEAVRSRAGNGTPQREAPGLSEG